MNEFIYVVKPNRPAMLVDGPNAEEARALEQHLDYLNGLLAEEQAILFGRTQTHDIHTFGIVIFEAQDEAAATAIMHADPAVRAGVMTARLFPYKIIGQRGR